MANRRAMKLFAVAILAGAAPAYADTATQASQGSTQVALTAEQQAVRNARLAYEAAQREPILPRLLASFRPACGNTGGKLDRPSDCTEAELRAADAYDKAYPVEAGKHNVRVKAAYEKLMAAKTVAFRADPTLEARLLVDGRPACGNTLSKSKPKPCNNPRAERDPVAAMLNGDR